MNLYPIEMAGLLSPPPPPPPPPPSVPAPPAATTVPSATGSSNVYIPQDRERTEIHHNQSTSFGYVQSYGHAPSYSQHHQETVGSVRRNLSLSSVQDNVIEPNTARHTETSHHFASSPVDGFMMLPPNHLRLPPPPPPPPPVQHLVPSSSQNEACNVLSPPTSHAPAQRDQFHLHDYNSPAHMQKKSYSAVPPPWVNSKYTPSGLQGPWKSPTSESDHRDYQLAEGNSVTHVTASETSTCINKNPSLTCSINSSGPSMTSAPTTYKDHKVNPKEPGMPRELTDMFEALHCKLCGVLSSSTVQAKLHYSGKPHEKKVRQWLLNWSGRTGLPVPKRVKVDSKVCVNPEDLFCHLCGVVFTSVKHGEQHKMGKAHQKALQLGYSSAKTKLKKAEVPFDTSGRFGIGEAFYKEKNIENEKDTPPFNASSTPSSLPAQSNKASSKFNCDLCKISATSQEHLDAHYAGAKHRKALAHAVKTDPPNSSQPSVIPPPVEPSESILASIIHSNDSSPSKTKGTTNDLSIYRTPSGIKQHSL